MSIGIFQNRSLLLGWRHVAICFFFCAPILAQTPQPQAKSSRPRVTGKFPQAEPGKPDTDSFRIKAPKLTGPRLAGLYEYSYRLMVPLILEPNIEVSMESGRVPMTPEQTHALAKQRLSEADRLRAMGTADSLRWSVTKYEESLRLLRASGRFGDPGEVASVLNHLASLSDSLGDRQQAINYFNQSIPLWRAANNRQSEAETLAQLGRIHNALGDKKLAQACYDRARLIVKTTGLMSVIGEGNRQASTFFNLGKLYEDQGEPQKAVEQYQGALAAWRQSGHRKGEASALNSIGSIAARGGQFTTATQLYELALPLWRAIGDKRGEAVSLSNLGFVADATGDKRRAIDLYSRALPLWREAGDKRGEATTLGDIAALHAALGNRPDAIKFYLEALPLRRETGDKRGEAGALNNLAGLYVNTGEPQRAIESYTRALQLRREIGDKRGEAITLGNLAFIHHSRGKLAQARESYEQSLALCRELKDREREITTLTQLAAIYSALGEKQKAADAYARLLPAWRVLPPR